MKRLKKTGFTLVEIMIVVAIIALLAAIAIPNVLRGRTSANESAAIGNSRALISSAEMYRSVNNVYAASASWQAKMYPAGGVPAFGPPSFNVAMTGQTVQGYNWTYTATPAACVDGPPGTCTGYTIAAVPQVLNQTGTRSFLATAAGTIAHVAGGVAPAATCTCFIDGAPGTSGAACPTGGGVC